MAAAAGSKPKKKVPPKRGQVLKRVVASILSWSWLPRRSGLLLRRNRTPHGRRGNRVPASGGHVEPEPDVAARRHRAATGGRCHGGGSQAHTNYSPAN